MRRSHKKQEKKKMKSNREYLTPHGGVLSARRRWGRRAEETVGEEEREDASENDADGNSHGDPRSARGRAITAHQQALPPPCHRLRPPIPNRRFSFASTTLGEEIRM